MIEIQVIGKLKLDDLTICLNPLVTVQSCLDNYFSSSVSVNSLFSNDNYYSFGRDCGSFIYKETWTDEDVENFMNAWIEEHRI
jgi:hypothetical protein